MSWNIGGDGGNSFPFDKIGDFVTGLVKSVEPLQQTDLNTKEPAVWKDGKPKMMYRIGLQTDLREDGNDDGMRSIYARGANKPESKSLQAAIRQAVFAVTGKYDLEYDGKLTVQYIGEGVPEQRGHNAPKHYAAWYERPAAGSLGAPPAPPVAAPPAQPVAAPAAPPAPPAPPAQPVAAPVAPPMAPSAAAPVVPAAPVAVPAPAAPAMPVDQSAQIAALRAQGLSDEALRGMGFAIPVAAAAPVDVLAAYAADPRVVALRSTGVMTDEQIKAQLQLA